MHQIEAVFENGVFRPLQPIRLAERQLVTVTIDDDSALTETVDQVRFTLSEDRWQAFCEALESPPKDIPALRKLLSEPSLFDGENKALS